MSRRREPTMEELEKADNDMAGLNALSDYVNRPSPSETTPLQLTILLEMANSRGDPAGARQLIEEYLLHGGVKL